MDEHGTLDLLPLNPTASQADVHWEDGSSPSSSRWLSVLQGAGEAEERRLEEHAAGSPPYDAAIHRAVSGLKNRLPAFDQAESEGRLLFEELQKSAAERWPLLLRNQERFRGLPLARRILGHVGRDVQRNPELAREIAGIARRMVMAEVSRGGWGALAWDVLGRAWAVLGHALHQLGDPVAAVAALEQGDRCLSSGTGDVLEQEELLGLKAALAGGRGDDEEAERCFAERIALYQEPESTEKMLAALLDHARYRVRRGDGEGARQLAWRALHAARDRGERAAVLQRWQKMQAL